MAVPEEIRAVERPANTVVDDSGKNGPKRYSVRERSSTKYVPGGNPQPRNGKVIGHIINLKFVPLVEKEKNTTVEPDVMSYGSSALVKSVSDDILDDLLSVYDPTDVYTIMAIASLKVIKPSVTAARMVVEYKRNFISMYYPGSSMSKNSIDNLYERLGMNGSKRREFYNLRIKRVEKDHHLAIDGTLKQDTSGVNDLSNYSHKARVRGCCEVSVIYLYDIELMEPICAEVFPGNCIDVGAFPKFIRNNNISKGLLIGNKGYPASKIDEELKKNPDLHILTPLKRTDVRITNNDMYNYQGKLEGISKKVLYCKKQIKGGRFLYSFRDIDTASAEDHTYVSRIDNEDFKYEDYANKKEKFGTMVLESDLDMDPKIAYTAYEDRWLLETVFKRYKNDICLNSTNVQNDFSVIGSEFVNFISTLITCRIINKATKANVLDKLTYKEMMDDLSSAWRKTNAPKVLPKRDDDYWIHVTNEAHDVLEALGLSEGLPKSEPKRRGRKPNPKVDAPKRPRGRPRKNNSQSIETV